MRDIEESAKALVRLAAQHVFSRAELKEWGLDRRSIRTAVAAGALVRARRDRYLRADATTQVIDAARAGGRLDCTSLLALLGVFIKEKQPLHVRVPPHAARLPVGTVLHWRVMTAEPMNEHAVAIQDAAIHAVLCQKPREAIATIDSLLHLHLLSEDEVDAVFRNLPVRLRILRRLVDGSAESGPESLMRLILRTLPVDIRTQVQISGVGRVDFLIDGWLIIECDGRRFHAGWDRQTRDRRRDVEAAAQGYVTLRFIAADILDDIGGIRTAIGRVLEALAPGSRPTR